MALVSDRWVTNRSGFLLISYHFSSSCLRNLPPPLRPSAPRRNSSGSDSDPWKGRGSLSDLSDYESSNEETHNARAGPSQRKARRSYVNVSDDPDEDGQGTRNTPAKSQLTDDPF